MGIWYQDDKRQFHYTERADLKRYYECIQELLLWQYENSFYQDKGINYKNILEKKALVNLEFERVLDKHRKYFQSIEFESELNNQEELNIKLHFVFESGETILKVITI